MNVSLFPDQSYPMQWVGVYFWIMVSMNVILFPDHGLIQNNGWEFFFFIMVPSQIADIILFPNQSLIPSNGFIPNNEYIFLIKISSVNMYRIKYDNMK